ncbi:MAG: hydroxypyruvate isomerase [Clostridia bacterium]|nr:hydroxypyruvate isomerase [Clostridia bacterium]
MMLNFDANLTMLFTELPFLERFEVAKKAGFSSVEFQFPYDFDCTEIEQTVKRLGLNITLFNLPAGNWGAGDRGIAADPSRIDEFRKGVATARQWAQRLGCQRLNCLVGLRLPEYTEEEQWKVVQENLAYAAEQLAKDNIMLLMEPLNTYDVPGFLISTTQQAEKLLNLVGAPNLRIQYDVYHMQRMEGELIGTLKQLGNKVGHIQIADNPGRHQPGTGEINYKYVLESIDSMGYKGYIGLEYIPHPNTETSLKWLEHLGF